ncbi:MAG TPA: hypothetical protein VF519_11410 [Mycobacteriales bacterium]|jgi:lincosamide nucleotidyltransferase A/C/D/E
MRAEAVVDLMRRLSAGGVTAWLDGGWAVDALLGEQTREHSDLDLVVDAEALDRVRALLDGWQVVRDELPSSLALRDPETGEQVDLHPVRLTPDGGGDQRQPDGSDWHYAAPVTGRVAGEPVPCCDLETQLRAHIGYEPREVDLRDVRALRERFPDEPP